MVTYEEFAGADTVAQTVEVVRGQVLLDEHTVLRGRGTQRRDRVLLQDLLHANIAKIITSITFSNIAIPFLGSCYLINLRFKELVFVFRIFRIGSHNLQRWTDFHSCVT